MRVLSAILSLLETQPHSASTLKVFISSASLVSLAGIRPCTQADWLWTPGDPKCQSLEPSTGPNPNGKTQCPQWAWGHEAPEKPSGLRMQASFPISSASWSSPPLQWVPSPFPQKKGSCIPPADLRAPMNATPSPLHP